MNLGVIPDLISLMFLQLSKEALTEQISSAVALLNYIREVPYTDLGPVTDYPESLLRPPVICRCIILN
jgi:hypothetical protein